MQFTKYYWDVIRILAKMHKVDLSTPFKDLPKKFRDIHSSDSDCQNLRSKPLALTCLTLVNGHELAHPLLHQIRIRFTIASLKIYNKPLKGMFPLLNLASITCQLILQLAVTRSVEKLILELLRQILEGVLRSTLCIFARILMTSQ